MTIGARVQTDADLREMFALQGDPTALSPMAPIGNLDESVIPSIDVYPLGSALALRKHDSPLTRMEKLADRWYHVAMLGTKRVIEAMRERSSIDAQRYAVPAGIATDKLQLLLGRPTEIVGHLEDNRVAFAKVVKLFAELDDEARPPRLVSPPIESTRESTTRE